MLIHKISENKENKDYVIQLSSSYKNGPIKHNGTNKHMFNLTHIEYTFKK